MIARVRGVIAARTAAGSMLNVTGSMSTNRGVAPSRLTQPAVAKNEYVGVMTSSPGPMPSAISATSSASVPDDTATASGDLERAPQARARALDLRAEDEALAVADPRDGGENLLPERQVLRLEIQQWHPRHRPRLHRITISGAPQNGRSLSGLTGAFGSLAYVLKIRSTCSPA